MLALLTAVLLHSSVQASTPAHAVRAAWLHYETQASYRRTRTLVLNPESLIVDDLHRARGSLIHLAPLVATLLEVKATRENENLPCFPGRFIHRVRVADQTTEESGCLDDQRFARLLKAFDELDRRAEPRSLN